MNQPESLAAIERFLKNASAADALQFIETLATQRPQLHAALLKQLKAVSIS